MQQNYTEANEHEQQFQSTTTGKRNLPPAKTEIQHDGV